MVLLIYFRTDVFFKIDKNIFKALNSWKIEKEISKLEEGGE